jgi:hypothetical protein
MTTTSSHCNLAAKGEFEISYQTPEENLYDWRAVAATDADGVDADPAPS